MMRNALVLFIFSILGMTACQEAGGRMTSSQGWEYINHTNKGGQTPQPGDWVYFHAEVRNGDSVFYDSRIQPEPPNFQIPSTPNPARKPNSVEDVVMNAAEGDSVTIFFPMDTVTNLPKGFSRTDVMEYDIVILDIQNQEEYQAALDEKRAAKQAKRAATQKRMEEVIAIANEALEQYKAGTIENLVTTGSGLKYVIHENGNGVKPETNQAIDVHYYGMLMDGKMFDSSFTRGEPIRFGYNTGRVIPGWDEGLGLISEGAKATFFIPANLAYGVQGKPPTIPGNSELVFYVELAKLY